MSVLYVLSAILLLGILVTVHEFGHFLFARLGGIEVKEFSIGMGPSIFSRIGKKHGTKFSLRLLPLGGYCAFYGEDEVDGKTVEDPRAFAKQPAWKRLIAILMGPGMNYVLAFLVLMFFFWVEGTPMYDPYIPQVEPNSPAMEAGIEAGDVIWAINGINVTDGTIETALNAIDQTQEGEQVQLTLRRGDEMVDVAATPFFDEALGRNRLGITISLAPRTIADANGELHPVRESIGLGDAATMSWDECVYDSTLILQTLKNMVTKGEGLQDTSGPVGVVTVVSQQVATGGLRAFMLLLAVISINLGVMNLLPIPGLDGSRLIFLVIEMIRRKPVKPEREAMVHLVGMGLLLLLMIVLTFKDIMNFFR